MSNKLAVRNVHPTAWAFCDKANGGRWYVTAREMSHCLGAGKSAAAAWLHARERIGK